MTRFILIAILIQLALAVALTSVTKALDGTPPYVHCCCDDQAGGHCSNNKVLEPVSSEYERPKARCHKKQTEKTITEIDFLRDA